MRRRILNVVTCHELSVPRSSPSSQQTWPVLKTLLAPHQHPSSCSSSTSSYFFCQIGLSAITGPPSSLFKWQPPPAGGWLYDESTSLGAPPNAYQVQTLAHAFSLALRQEQLRNDRYTCFWRLRPDGMLNVAMEAADVGLICDADTAVFHGHMEHGAARVLTDFM